MNPRYMFRLEKKEPLIFPKLIKKIMFLTGQNVILVRIISTVSILYEKRNNKTTKEHYASITALFIHFNGWYYFINS